jgi:hypothetical protein
VWTDKMNDKWELNLFERWKHINPKGLMWKNHLTRGSP